MKKFKNNKKLLMVLSVLLLVVIATGITYAFFNYSKAGSTENTLKSGSITFWYEEVDKQGNGISIEDALPMSDADGKAQAKSFNFRITSTASSTTTIPYEITLRQKQGTDNIGDIVKVYLSKVDESNNEEESELSVFNDLTTVEHNGYQEKLLHKDIAPASEEKYIQNYRLRIWIDGSVDFKGIENEETHEVEYPYQNKTFTVMVNVYANGHVLTESSQVATINSVSVDGTELTKKVVSGIDTYETMLPEGTTSATISVDTGDYDKVTITKTESDYTTPVAVANNIERLSNTTNKTVSLTDGGNYFKIVATSEDNTGSKEIHVMIKSIKIHYLVKDGVLVDKNYTIANSGWGSLSQQNGYVNLYLWTQYAYCNGIAWYIDDGTGYTNTYIKYSNPSSTAGNSQGPWGWSFRFGTGPAVSYKSSQDYGTAEYGNFGGYGNNAGTFTTPVVVSSTFSTATTGPFYAKLQTYYRAWNVVYSRTFYIYDWYVY